MDPIANDPNERLSRRVFLGGSVAISVPLGAAAWAGATEPKPPAHPPSPFPRKIKLGLVGCGGRGRWIAGLFQKHGGFQFHALADYFPEVADAGGEAFGIDRARRFSGLSGYRKVVESGVEAVVLEVPPHFFPEQVRAAVEAGLHVYMAKPVAVDVPGCLAIEALAKQATQKKLCFLVDYQMPTHPIHIEVAKRIRQGALGKLAWVATFGFSSGFSDPPKTATIESRLRGLVWVNDVALGGDNVVNYDIHAIDAAIWVLGQRPVAAAGSSRIARPDPHGDARDVCSVVFELADGLVWNHSGQALPNNTDSLLLCQLFGQKAYAQLNYWGKAFVRGGTQHYGGGNIENLYETGAARNIADFYDAITQGRFDNPTVQRAVDGALTAILAREAAARHTRLTLDQLIQENKKLEVDLTGLKA